MITNMIHAVVVYNQFTAFTTLNRHRGKKKLHFHSSYKTHYLVIDGSWFYFSVESTFSLAISEHRTIEKFTWCSPVDQSTPVSQKQKQKKFN